MQFMSRSVRAIQTVPAELGWPYGGTAAASVKESGKPTAVPASGTESGTVHPEAQLLLCPHPVAQSTVPPSTVRTSNRRSGVRFVSGTGLPNCRTAASSVTQPACRGCIFTIGRTRTWVRNASWISCLSVLIVTLSYMIFTVTPIGNGTAGYGPRPRKLGGGFIRRTAVPQERCSGVQRASS